MTATLEQTQTDLLRLIGLAQKGEDVVIVNHGHAVAKLTAMRETLPASSRSDWLARLATLRQRLATGKTAPSVEQILDEDRGS